MTLERVKPGSPQDSYGASAYPVLQGLACSPLSGAEIAGYLGVPEIELAKWRDGKVQAPGAKLAFLTLLLAHLLDEMAELERLEEKYAVPEAPWREDIRHKVAAAERCLAHQEMLNAQLPTEDLREGAALFRQWVEVNGRAVTDGRETDPLGC
ncbi:MAG: hypothetical protein ACPGOV_06940 [Magnetovibrionaceae bacterium]